MFFKREVYFKLITITVIVVIALVGVEVVLRVKGDTYSWSEKNGHGYQSPYGTPCLQMWTVKGDYKYDKFEYDYSVTVNRVGIRDVNHSINKDTSIVRIIGLGDSFTEGAGAPFDSTWLSLLEDESNQFLNDSVEVISGGVSGSDFAYSYKLFRDSLSKYNPDIVLFVINNTDVTDYFVRGGLDRFHGDTCYTKPAPKVEWLFRKSHLVRSIMVNILGYNWQLISEQEKKILWNSYYHEVLQITQNIHSHSLLNGYEVYFIFHPLVHEIKQGKYDYNFELLGDELNSLGVEVIDLFTVLSEQTYYGDSISKLYWPVDQHLNSRGYNVFATEVRQRIFKEH